MITIDTERCTKCGLCTKHCFLEYLKIGENGYPQADEENVCSKCGQCVSICPEDAVSVAGLKTAELSGKIGAKAMSGFLRSKRSCRYYKEQPVEKSVMESLLQSAAMAPSTFNAQERAVVIVTNPEVREKIRLAMAKQVRMLSPLLRFVNSGLVRLFLGKEMKAYLFRTQIDVEMNLKHLNEGRDALLHNAPAVVFFCGKKDMFGKDHALTTMDYFIMQAEAEGLGTCLIGYGMSDPKGMAKIIPVPKGYKVYGVITMGYPKYEYQRSPVREQIPTEWME